LRATVSAFSGNRDSAGPPQDHVSIAGSPSGATFSSRSKSLWMMFRPEKVKKTEASIPDAAAVVARIRGG